MKFLLALGLASGFVVCTEKGTWVEESDVIHEEAVVTQKVYRGSTFQSPGMNKIIFDGADVDFEVESYPGSGENEFYEKFNKGDKVDISYNTIYKVTFEDLNKDGVKEETDRKIDRYKIIDIKPKQ